MKQINLSLFSMAVLLLQADCLAYAQVNKFDSGSIQNRVSGIARTGDDPGCDMSIQACHLRDSGQYREAEEQFKAALAYWSEHPPSELHVKPACLNNLGLLYFKEGQFSQAVPSYMQALELEEKSLSANDPLIAFTADNMAQAYRLQGKLKEAEPLYLKALSIEEKSMSPDDQSRAITTFNLSLLYFQMEKYDQCEPLMQQSLPILKKNLGENNPDYLGVYKYYLALLRKTNRSQQADILEQQIEQRQSQ